MATPARNGGWWRTYRSPTVIHPQFHPLIPGDAGALLGDAAC